MLLYQNIFVFTSVIQILQLMFQFVLKVSEEKRFIIFKLI